MTIYSKSQITVEGLDELIQAFKDLPDEAMTYLKDASNDAGDIVLENVKNRASQYHKYSQKGKLVKNLVKRPAKSSNKYKYRVFSSVTFRKAAAEAVPLELGHHLIFFGKDTNSEVEPKPFMRPGADESERAVISEIANGMNKALKNMGGRR